MPFPLSFHNRSGFAASAHLQQPMIFEQQMAGPSARHQVLKALAIVVEHLRSVEALKVRLMRSGATCLTKLVEI